MNEPRTITFRVCVVARQRNVTRVRFASPSIGSTSGVPDRATRSQNASVLLSPAAICFRSASIAGLVYLSCWGCDFIRSSNESRSSSFSS